MIESDLAGQNPFTFFAFYSISFLIFFFAVYIAGAKLGVLKSFFRML